MDLSIDVIALVGILLAIFPVVFSYYQSILSDTETENFRELQARVSGEAGAPQTFRNGIKSIAAFLDRFFEQSPGQSPLRPVVLSANSFDRSLLLAVFYPFTLVLVIWVATGSAGVLAESFGLSENATLGFRFSMGGLWVAVLAIAARALHRATTEHDVSVFPPILILLFGSHMIAGLFETERILAVNFLIVSLILAVNSPKLRHGLLVIGWPLAISMASTFYTGSAENTGSSLFPIVLNVCLFLFCIFYILNRFQGTKLYGRAQIGIVLVYTSICFTTVLGVDTEFERLYFPLWFWLFIFPLCNGIFDWISISITRFCIRMAAGENLSWRQRTKWLAIDLLCSLICVAGLLVLMLLFMQLVDGRFREFGELPVFNFQSNFDWLGLIQNNFWFFAAISTAFIPSLFHLIIWCISWIPFGLVGGPLIRRSVAPERLEKGGGAKWQASALLSLQLMQAIVISSLMSIAVLMACFYVVSNLMD